MRDFFEHQELARRNSRRLVFLVALAVVAVFAAVYFLMLAALTYVISDEGEFLAEFQLVNWPIFWISLVSVVTIVGLGSAWKLWTLRGGGRVVAESMGGRLILPQTQDFKQRRVLNVVEEMALASGVPVPPVYLLEEEDGINAFAAGYETGDAVIGVTQGTVNLLNREELQGVIGHEFSHVLNGDMRLNLRLIGLAHGILVLGLVGEMIMRSAGRSKSSSSKKKDGNSAVFLFGAGLLIIGWVGTLSANMIKSAISRQREFLADASAVQYTRNPLGLSGALKKIGGLGRNSRKMAASTREISHMLFSARLEKHFTSLMATHPPLKQRILRLEPDFDGRFEPLKPSAGAAVSAAAGHPGASGLAGSEAGGETVGETAKASRFFQQAGAPSEQDIAFASGLFENLPEAVQESVRDPFGARAVVYALLLDGRSEVRSEQMKRLQEEADPQVLELTQRLARPVRQAGPKRRLPLVDMALPALRGLAPGQYRTFRRCLDVLIEADQEVSLFEWVLRHTLQRHLAAEFEPSRPAKIRHISLSQKLALPCSVLLSRLAYAGHGDPIDARQAFDRGAKRLGLSGLQWCSLEECGLDALDRALQTLDECSPRIKRTVLEACAATISSNDRVTVKEGEMLRGIGDALGCPIPPLAPGD
ncbi:MAG TPA: M48 family metallopeptidase [Acidobacteriota bacterium]|nr:M48 family metallopeptidase [Acidobacteriota bacterium]